MTKEPGDEIKNTEENPIDPMTEIPASPVETPAITPADDPEVIVTATRSYVNSLHALLQLNVLQKKIHPTVNNQPAREKSVNFTL